MVVAGPSGVGKGTIIRRLMEKFPDKVITSTGVLWLTVATYPGHVLIGSLFFMYRPRRGYNEHE